MSIELRFLFWPIMKPEKKKKFGLAKEKGEGSMLDKYVEGVHVLDVKREKERSDMNESLNCMPA